MRLIQARSSTAKLDHRDVTIIRDTHTAEDGFDLFVEQNDADNLRSTLTNAGAEPVSDATAGGFTH